MKVYICVTKRATIPLAPCMYRTCSAIRCLFHKNSECKHIFYGHITKQATLAARFGPESMPNPSRLLNLGPNPDPEL